VTQSTMTNEELDEYIRLGMTAAIANKAGSLQNALEHLRVTFAKASGTYHSLRFKSAIYSVVRASEDFMLAMETKEAYAAARKMEKDNSPAQPEAGDDIPVQAGRGEQTTSTDGGEDGMAVLGGRTDPDRD
jgi:hypothetical protein